MDQYDSTGTCTTLEAGLSYVQAVYADNNGDCCINFDQTDKACPDDRGHRIISHIDTCQEYRVWHKIPANFFYQVRQGYNSDDPITGTCTAVPNNTEITSMIKTIQPHEVLEQHMTGSVCGGLTDRMSYNNAILTDTNSDCCLSFGSSFPGLYDMACPDGEITPPGGGIHVCPKYRVWNETGSNRSFMINGDPCITDIGDDPGIDNGTEITDGVTLEATEVIFQYQQHNSCGSLVDQASYNQAIIADLNADCCVNFVDYGSPVSTLIDRTCPMGSDNDGDGYTTPADCNDGNANINPGAVDICDNVDNDCDWTIDEGFDIDNDGYKTCTGDCDDVNASIHPGVPELCDNVDNNCNGIIDEGFDVDCSPSVVLSVLSGWNLISLPSQPSNTLINTLLNPIAGLYNMVWSYENSVWKMNNPSTPAFNTLESMEAGKGYWIYMNTPATLSISGGATSNSVQLASGWNLVGYNSKTAQPIADVLASIDGKFISVWAFINNEWQFYAPGNIFNTLETMEPGYGYWINTTEACTWTLP